MKKYLFLLMFFLSGSLMAQNLQLHYDMGKDRHYFTSTLEMFKPDEYGSTFLFIDMDYNRGGNKSASLGYMEIARYVNLPFVKGLSATVQYNDGLIYNKDLNMDFPLGPVWLGGFSYPIDLGFVTLNTDLLYRADYLSESKANAQVTTVWFKSFFDNRVNFTGFMDIWSTKQAGKNHIVLLTEPQIWFNLVNHLAVGSEVEISNNFIPGKSSVQVNPTIAAKWTF
ncbi:MAG TPA: DUF5020 family protein [Ignavibacteriales bacterium]|nr:DUF5020 family protein [Ignavibacteriales bacterium]